MEIFFCELCGRRINPADIDAGRCKREGAMAWCPACTLTLAPPPSSSRAPAMGAAPSGSRAPVIHSPTREMRRTPAPGLPKRPPTVYKREPVAMPIPAPVHSTGTGRPAADEHRSQRKSALANLPPAYLAVGAGMLALIMVLGVYLLLAGPQSKTAQAPPSTPADPTTPKKQSDPPRSDPPLRTRPPDPPPTRTDPPKDPVVAPKLNPPAEVVPGFQRAHDNLEKDLADLAKLPATLPRLLATRPRGADPVIDGKLDDPCWAAAPEQKLFFMDGRNETPNGAGTFRVLASDKALFIGAKFFDDELASIGMPTKPHDKDPWVDDAIEIFMLPGMDANTKYYQWITNIAGSTWEGYGYKWLDPKAWDPPNVRFEIKRYPDEKCWCVEIAIPFADMPLLQEHALWRFNLYRNRPKRPSGANDGYTAWSPTNVNNTHTPPQFGVLAIEAMGGKLP